MVIGGQSPEYAYCLQVLWNVLLDIQEIQQDRRQRPEGALTLPHEALQILLEFLSPDLQHFWCRISNLFWRKLAGQSVCFPKL